MSECWVVASTAKPRVSRFSNSLLTKKIYFPTHNTDIDYASIFNSPFRIEVETDTHTTITVGGTALRAARDDYV